jgi:cell wall-associated NlpC family hydrolase
MNWPFLVWVLIICAFAGLRILFPDGVPKLESEPSEHNSKPEFEVFISQSSLQASGSARDYRTSTSTINGIIDICRNADDALFCTSAADIVSKPSGQVLSQAFYLDPVIVVGSQDENGMLLVELPAQRGYRGYLRANEVAGCDQILPIQLAVVKSLNTWVRDARTGEESKILQLGAIVPVLGAGGDEIQISAFNDTYWVSSESLYRISDGRKPKGDEIVQTAERFLGHPFLSGGNSYGGFDSGGFVYFVYRLNGVFLYRTPAEQLADAEFYDINAESIGTGDLVFRTFKSGAVEVGILSSSDVVIYASATKGVVEEQIDNSPFAPIGSAKIKRFRGLEINN